MADKKKVNKGALSVWISDVQKARVEEAAFLEGMGVSEFVRVEMGKTADKVITEHKRAKRRTRRIDEDDLAMGGGSR